MIKGDKHSNLQRQNMNYICKKFMAEAPGPGGNWKFAKPDDFEKIEFRPVIIFMGRKGGQLLSFNFVEIKWMKLLATFVLKSCGLYYKHIVMVVSYSRKWCLHYICAIALALALASVQQQV
jgi:hypothetical protein